MNQIIIYIKEKNVKTLKNGGKTLNKKEGWGKEKREQKKERREKEENVALDMFNENWTH